MHTIFKNSHYLRIYKVLDLLSLDAAKKIGFYAELFGNKRDKRSPIKRSSFGWC